MNELQTTNTTPTVADSNGISTVNVDQALAEWNAYQRITREMLDETDYQDIKGKKYKKKSAWRKYKRAFNIDTEIIEKEIIKTEKTGAVKEANFIVRATLPNGCFADGWGNCSRGERGFAHPNHDIPATAQTRATNRAIADLIGAGEVTAEEIQAEMMFQKQEAAKQRFEESKAKAKTPEPEVVDVDVEVVEEPKMNTFDSAKEIAKSIVDELPQKNILFAKLKLKELLEQRIVKEDECQDIIAELERLLS